MASRGETAKSGEYRNSALTFVQSSEPKVRRELFYSVIRWAGRSPSRQRYFFQAEFSALWAWILFKASRTRYRRRTRRNARMLSVRITLRGWVAVKPARWESDGVSGRYRIILGSVVQRGNIGTSDKQI